MYMTDRAIARTLLLSGVLYISGTVTATCLEAADGSQIPRILKPPVIEMTCTAGTGRTLVSFRNDSDKPLSILLSAGPLLGVGDTKTANSQVMFAAENDKGPGKPDIELLLPAGGTAGAQAVAGNIWDAGQFEADLENRGEKIGTLKVSSYCFNVKRDGVTEATANLNLADGKPAALYLKNDDPIPYALTYRLLIDGHELARKEVTIARNGNVRLELLPSIPIEWINPQWYFARLQDLLKPDTSTNGSLLLYLRQPGGRIERAAPVQTIPLKISLSFFDPASREALSYLLIIIVLVLGGISSLVLSSLLPNRIQKLDITEQLNSLARTTSNLSSHVSSRLGVLVRVERSRLSELLASRATTSPDFLGILTRCKQGVANLAARIAMLQQMDLVLEQLAKLIPLGVPPSQVDQIEGYMDKATVLLGKAQPTDADLQAAQSAIADAGATVDAINRPNEVFGQDLAKRVHALVEEINSNLAAMESFVRIKNAVPGAFKILTNVKADAATLDASLYSSVDMALAKVQLVREYVLLSEGTKDPEMLERLKSKESKLLKFLQLDTAQALRAARGLVREMEGDVYPERLVQALAATPPQEAFICMEPHLAYEGQPLTFRVEFRSAALDTAAAREEWTCDWEFGDGLKERGQSVSHYFLLPRPGFLRRRAAKTFTVTARFQDAEGHEVLNAQTQPAEVTRQVEVRPIPLSSWLGERTVTEAIRLAAALLIAVFGLLAGARDQLLKLDVLPGLVAVFLVGFGADTIKNLLTPK